MKQMLRQHSSSAQVSLRSRWARVTVLVAVVLAVVAGVESESRTDETTAPGGYRLLDEDGVVNFPFDIYGGDIRFRAQINGHDVHLLLDDGFMWDPLLFWGGPDVDALGLEPDGRALIGDPDDESAIPSTIAVGISLRLPGVEFTDQTAIITPATSGTSEMWTGSVGQVSATLFKHFVVDINFDTMMITLIDPRVFEYRGKGVPVPWKPLPVGAWSIPGTLRMVGGRRVTMDLMMDLGFNAQMQVVTGDEHDFVAPEGARPADFGMNIQRQVMRGCAGRLPGVEIGGFEVADVPTEFVSKESGAQIFHEAMIGLGLLSRFNLVFDYSRQRLFVEPNGNFTKPFSNEKTHPAD